LDNWFETLVSPFVALAAVFAGLVLLYMLRRRLSAVVTDLRISKIGAGGFSIEFIEQQTIEAYEKQGLGPPSANDRRKVRELAQHIAPLAAGRKILWVDDNPGGNVPERAMMREWRIEVQTRRTTDEALTELADPVEQYDLVISDWIRPTPESPKSEEGIRMLMILRQTGIDVPVVFYHGAVSDDVLRDRRARARAAGALGATGSPGELYQFVLLELVRSALAE
jgi:CheY-like chemotaxis protein